MKILFLTNIPSHYRIDFFNELGKSCDLTVAYERNSTKTRNDEWLKNKAWSFNEIYLSGLKFGDASALCFDVLKLLNKEKFDLIIVGGYNTPTGILSILYMKMKRIRYVQNVDGGRVKKDGKIKRFVKKFFIGSAFAWLCPSKVAQEYLKHYGADKEMIFEYNFTSLFEKEILIKPLTKKEKNEIKTKLKIEGKKTAIAVGRYIKLKNFDLLIKAWKKINPNYRLYIVGEGEEKDNYEKILNENRINNVELIEFLTKEELFEYYKSSDLFIHPSRTEAWGLVINESMACGLPVIATKNCVAALELICDDENGYLIPIDDENELEKRIIALLDNDNLREKMALNNVEKIKKYTFENMAKQHIGIFKEILKKRGD